jgi:hypothetical protein
MSTKNKDPSQKYYNILVKNNNTGYDKNGNTVPTTNAVELTFEQTRTIPYIYNPRDFYMSVVGFEMDTQSVPVFICDPIVGSTDINETVYTITMEHNGAVQQLTIKWFPEDASATVPTAPVSDKYNMDYYYYAYTYQHLINVVNKGLQDCWNALSIAPITNTTSIFMTLVDNRVSLYANKTLCMTNSTGVPINNAGSALINYVKIYFNTELSNLFSSLESIKVAQPLVVGANSFLNSNYQLIFPNNKSSYNTQLISGDITTVPPSNNHLMMINHSEYSPLPYWNPIDKVTFMTAQLPVVPQLIAAASNYYNNTQNSGVNANTSYILCDFSAALSKGTEYKPNISYLPPAEYVLAELYGDTPLYSISIYVFWKDKFGDFHPFLLEAGGTALLKIMFRKKDFYE